MDPCTYVRVLVGNLALRIPVAARPARSGVHPSTSPCYVRIRLNNLAYQTAAVPLVPAAAAANASDNSPPFPSLPLAAGFHLSRADLDRMSSKHSFFSFSAKLKLEIYTGRRGTTCGINSGHLLGKISIPLDLKQAADGRAVVFHSGWISIGKDKGLTSSGAGSSAEVYVTVRAEPDPRFVFEFGDDPECSPQVFQLQGSMPQPVFTLKFSCRNAAADRHHRSRSMQFDSGGTRNWLPSFGSERERVVKERKGWSVTVHDLPGSPVALASMVTPFVPSPGSDRVSRSNPGAWLVLRPGDGTWKPWGRLECWRERGGSSDGLGYRFDLLPDAAMNVVGISLAESTISTSKGGRFTIDLTRSVAVSGGSRSGSPGCSPRCSGDFGYSLWPASSYRGFVMSSMVRAEGRSCRPTVEVGVRYVGCTEDAAVFVALAAAMDLSMDACRLFSHKLRKELECI